MNATTTTALRLAADALTPANTAEEQAALAAIAAAQAEVKATDLSAPTPNLNGATRESLIDEKRAVLDALHATKDALSRSAPHGRDYQLAADPAAALERDIAIYRARHAALTAIYDAVTAEALALLPQH